MQVGLKSFILQEEMQISHAERYVTYVDRYNSEVLLDLKHTLEADWSKTITQLEKIHKPSPESKQEAQLQNPKASLDLKLIRGTVKLTTARSRTPIEVSPSVKIPHIYKHEQRDLVLKALLKTAHEALLQVTSKWKEIFNYERRGKLSPWFKITQDRDELRIQLAATAGDETSYRTLYSIRVEYGKSNSKLRDYDRVYLHSSI